MARLLCAVKCKDMCRVCLYVVSSMALCLNGSVVAQQPGQKTFVSPEAASKALFAAAQADDQVAMLEIFGPFGNEITSTGDALEDADSRDHFVAKYREMHHLREEPNGSVTIYIGGEDWPFPVPLVNSNGTWHFDTEAGENEILYRRIGENEFAAINVCHVLVDAEKEYYSHPREGTLQQFAQVLVSDEGKYNGLFWKGSDGEPESPIGPLVAYAAGPVDGQPRGYESSPFYGYYHRILTGQGEASPGGVKSYIVNGKMIGGFAVIAYPADYRSSGVMTFIVNQSGVIYQKDLGDETAETPSVMMAYAPDKTWEKVE